MIRKVPNREPHWAAADWYWAIETDDMRLLLTDHEMQTAQYRAERNPEDFEREEPEPEEPPVEDPEPEPGDDDNDDPAEWFSGRYALSLDGLPGMLDIDAGTVTLPIFGRVAAAIDELGGKVIATFEVPGHGEGTIELTYRDGALSGHATTAGQRVPVTGQRESEAPEPEPQEPLPPVEPNPDAPPWRANEPRGFTTLTDRAFDAINEPGWSHTPSGRTDGTQARFEIVRAPDAPVSPPSVGRITFPRGHTGSGSSSYNVHVGHRLATPRRLYLALALRMSPNWYGHSGSSVNKVLYIGQSTMLLVRGGRNNPLFPRFGTQGAENRNCDWDSEANRAKPTREQAEIRRGAWHNIEVLMEMGDRGQPNGAVKLWKDGVLILDFVGIRMLRATDDQYGEIGSIRWHPIYGGQGGVDVPADQWQEIDHFYISAEH